MNQLSEIILAYIRLSCLKIGSVIKHYYFSASHDSELDAVMCKYPLHIAFEHFKKFRFESCCKKIRENVKIYMFTNAQALMCHIQFPIKFILKNIYLLH